MKITELYFIPDKFHIEWVNRAQVIGSQIELKGTALFHVNRALG